MVANHVSVSITLYQCLFHVSRPPSSFAMLLMGPRSFMIAADQSSDGLR